MLTKTKIALAAALMLGTASVALARGMGGSDIGPLGQCFNPPDCGGPRDGTTLRNKNAGTANGFVQPAKHKHRSPRPNQ
jgi:hypothetical protein